MVTSLHVVTQIFMKDKFPKIVQKYAFWFIQSFLIDQLILGESVVVLLIQGDLRSNLQHFIYSTICPLKERNQTKNKKIKGKRRDKQNVKKPRAVEKGEETEASKKKTGSDRHRMVGENH